MNTVAESIAMAEAWDLLLGFRFMAAPREVKAASALRQGKTG